MIKIRNLEQLTNRRKSLELQKAELEKLIRNDWIALKRNLHSPVMRPVDDKVEGTDNKKVSEKSLKQEVVSGLAVMIFRKIADRIQARMYNRNKR